jgi:hypothetical protein
MHENMPMEARCQENRGINAKYLFSLPEKRFPYYRNVGFQRPDTWCNISRNTQNRFIGYIHKYVRVTTVYVNIIYTNLTFYVNFVEYLNTFALNIQLGKTHTLYSVLSELLLTKPQF